MTARETDRKRDQARNHQQLLRKWRRRKGPCIICAEREGNERDHLPPKVLFPATLRTHETPLFTFPVCSNCNRSSSDEDFLFSVLLSFGLNQEAILSNREPTDPELQTLYRQTQGHFQDPRKAVRCARLLSGLVGTDPKSGRPANNAEKVPTNQTLTKIAKSIYWSHTGGDILQKHNPGWWIAPFVDTSKPLFIEKHLKTSHAEVNWGDRFIYHYTIGHPEDGVGGFIWVSLHFYTKKVVGKGMSWMLLAAPTRTSVNGRSLYDWMVSIRGPATIEPRKEERANKSVDHYVSPGADAG